MRKHVYIQASVAVPIILSGCTQNRFLRTFFKKQKNKRIKKITSSYIELTTWLVSEIETSLVSKLTLVLMEIDLCQADNSRFLGVNHSWVFVTPFGSVSFRNQSFSWNKPALAKPISLQYKKGFSRVNWQKMTTEYPAINIMRVTIYWTHEVRNPNNISFVAMPCKKAGMSKFSRIGVCAALSRRLHRA